MLVGGVLLWREAAVRALQATCAPSPCASKVRRKPEAFPLRGLGFPRTQRIRGVASVGKSGMGEVLKCLVREDQSLNTRVSLNRSERMGSLRTEAHQAVVSWFCSLIARSCMHDIYLCVLGLAEDMETRVLKSSPLTKAPGNTPRAKACPTQDGRPGLRRQRGRDGGYGASRFRRKTRAVFMI